MQALAQRLYEAIAAMPIVDPHSHISPAAAAATSLNDLLGYHYYTELAHSAGIPRPDLEQTDPRQKARRIVAGLAHCKNTVQFRWLLEIVNDLLGFETDRIDQGNIDALFEHAERTLSTPDWQDRLWRKTNLEAVFLTNDFDDPLEGFDTARFVPCLRTDDLVFKLDQEPVRQRLRRATGESLGNFAEVEKGLDRLFEHFVAKHARAAAISLPPDFAPRRPQRSNVDRAWSQFLAGTATDDDRVAVSHAVFYALADRCEAFGLPFDLMIGVWRDVYPSGVHQGRDLYDKTTSLYQFRHLFNDKPRVVFPISVLTHNQNQELVSYAWIFPNVVTHGHWWYSNVPSIIEADLRARLEAAPLNKQIGYYSDAYKLEFILPKYNMYRRCLARVLAEDFVIARGWTEERALEVAQAILRDNITRLFPAKT